MRIIVDVMGSDLGPAPIIKGAIVAKEEFGNDLTFVGDRDVIRKAAESCKLSLDGIRIVHASDMIRMTDDPMSVRSKTDSSMRVALRLLADGEGDALVSCGNTGALQTGATLFVKRIKGIHRAAIGAILPMEKPLLVLDSGANLTVTPEYLAQFAVMGSVYMEKLFDLSRARVGLLNIGTEEKKGNPLQVDSYQLLKNSNIHFVGNIEGKDIPFNKCDLVVTDGFTGNVLLKVVEGMGGYMIKMLKELFYANTKTKL
ncbi:MAG: phosphate acyltransferase PlsX, partial [Eubacteriales bacterium]